MVLVVHFIQLLETPSGGQTALVTETGTEKHCFWKPDRNTETGPENTQGDRFTQHMENEGFPSIKCEFLIV